MSLKQNDKRTPFDNLTFKTNVYPKSLKKYYYFKCVAGEAPTPLNIAYLGDALIKEAQLFTLIKISKQIGYKIKTRNKITDYKRRKAPKIRIGKYVYYLTK